MESTLQISTPCKFFPRVLQENYILQSTESQSGSNALGLFGRLSLLATQHLVEGLWSTQNAQSPPEAGRPRWYISDTHKPNHSPDVLHHSSTFGQDFSCTRTRSCCSLPNTASLILPSDQDPANTC